MHEFSLKSQECFFFDRLLALKYMHWYICTYMTILLDLGLEQRPSLLQSQIRLSFHWYMYICMYVHKLAYLFIKTNYQIEISKFRTFFLQLSFKLEINKIEMSSEQTPRPITNTAPATAVRNRQQPTPAPPSTTTAPPVANTTAISTQAHAATPAPPTAPVNQPPASTTLQATQMHPLPTVHPLRTVTPPNTPAGDKVNELIIITESATYIKLLKDVGNKYLLVEFYAPWCGACMLINRKLEELAASYSGKLIIAKVNIDDCEQIAIDNNVSMMPSFMLLKESQVLEKFAGSSEEKLMSTIQKHVGEPTNVVSDPPTTNPTTTAGQGQQRIPIESTAQIAQASPLAPT